MKAKACTSTALVPRAPSSPETGSALEAEVADGTASVAVEVVVTVESPLVSIIVYYMVSWYGSSVGFFLVKTYNLNPILGIC